MARGASKAYQDFLETKQPKPLACGPKTIPDLPASLKPFQRDIVAWAIHMGRAAIFAGTGLGKSLMQLAWADAMRGHTKSRGLILTPLAVAQQTVGEAAKFGISDVAYAKDESSAQSSIVVTNYDRVEKFNVSDYGFLVLDECFARGTKVDTPTGKKNIEDIREGDLILNASGVDRVMRTKCTEVTHAIKVTIGVSNFIASPNHPVFTQRGWVAAQYLRAGDYALETATAVRMVRRLVSTRVSGPAGSEILRHILLSEMAHEYAGAQSKGAYAGGGSQTRSVEVGVAKFGRSARSSSNRENTALKPDERSWHQGEIVQNVAGHGSYDQGAWRERPSINCSAIEASGRSWERMGAGICGLIGDEDGRLPNELQGGHCALGSEGGDRGGRSLASITQGSGQKKGRYAGFARVDSVEILELGHPELAGCGNARGQLYFYDIQAERHPSFSVNGILVHNSSIIKAHDSKTRVLLTEICAGIPFKLCCTATPSPNDYQELGQHSEFLNVLTAKEMLATWFVHDGSIRATNAQNHGSKPIADWRLKGHAEKDFWRWLSTWAVVIRHPRDVGYDEDGYDLPPLHKHQVTVPVDYVGAQSAGMLFAMEAVTLADQRAAARASIDARVKAAAEIIMREPDEPWLVWCQLNDEADAMRGAVPGMIEVRGSDDPDQKADRLLGFGTGKYNRMVTKGSIAGFGLNWQRCARQIHLGINHSFETQYQAIRRSWRFGQTRPVHVYVIAAETEGAVVSNLEAKEKAADYMLEQMAEHMKDLTARSLRGARPRLIAKHNKKMELPAWLK